MKRRSFLGLVAAAPVVAAAAALPETKPFVARYTHKTVALGFGLAPVKAEGAMLAIDPLPFRRSASFELLQADLEKVWADAYKDYPVTELYDQPDLFE